MVLMRALLIGALAAVVVGLVVVVVTGMSPATFGWLGTETAPGGTFSLGGLHVISTTGLAGLGIAVLGLVALALWAGMRIGRRQRSEG